MGKGDRRSRRGKIRLGSFGKSRPNNRKRRQAKAIAIKAAQQAASASKA